MGSDGEGGKGGEGREGKGGRGREGGEGREGKGAEFQSQQAVALQVPSPLCTAYVYCHTVLSHVLPTHQPPWSMNCLRSSIGGWAPYVSSCGAGQGRRQG